MAEQIVFLTNVVSTLMMTGIMWFVHLIHYPVLSYVNQTELAQYEQQHVKHTMKWAVLILVIEVVSATLLFWFRPANISIFPVAIGFALLIPIWVTTWSSCVPAHCKLENGFNSQVLQKLMKANFLRTLCWTFRTVIVIWMLSKVSA